MFDCILEKLPDGTAILLSLAILLLAGFLMTRITKLLKLPNVSGYIIAGIIIGPHLLNLIPMRIINGMSFFSDIALAFIAFGVGRFFRKDTLRETGWGVIVITVLEALLAGAIVFAAMYFAFGLDLGLSLLLGAIATATAPASTMMTINQYHARGKFVSILLQVVALDDVVCLLVFSAAASVIGAMGEGSVSAAGILLPLAYNLAAIILGAIFGLILAKLLSHRSDDNRLILAVALLLGLSGLCSIFDISPLLSCMVFGAVYMNMTLDKELYKQINRFTPPIMSIFFVMSGTNLDVSALGAFGVVGIVYFLVRIVGKYAGAYLGCLITHEDKPIRNYLGLALIPQAGVAIGLAYLGKRILPDDIGSLLMTIVLSSSVLYELIGPGCAKLAIFKTCTLRGEEKRTIVPPKKAAEAVASGENTQAASDETEELPIVKTGEKNE